MINGGCYPIFGHSCIDVVKHDIRLYSEAEHQSLIIHATTVDTAMDACVLCPHDVPHAIICVSRDVACRYKISGCYTGYPDTDIHVVVAVEDDICMQALSYVMTVGVVADLILSADGDPTIIMDGNPWPDLPDCDVKRLSIDADWDMYDNKHHGVILGDPEAVSLGLPDRSNDYIMVSGYDMYCLRRFLELVGCRSINDNRIASIVSRQQTYDGLFVRFSSGRGERRAMSKFVPRIYNVCDDWLWFCHPMRTDAEIDAYAASHGWMRATEFLASCGIVAKHIGWIDTMDFVAREDRTDIDRVTLMYILLDCSHIKILEDNRTQDQRQHDADTWMQAGRTGYVMHGHDGDCDFLHALRHGFV